MCSTIDLAWRISGRSNSPRVCQVNATRCLQHRALVDGTFAPFVAARRGELVALSSMCGYVMGETQPVRRLELHRYELFADIYPETR